MVADILQTRTTADWLAFFEDCDTPCASMHDLDALIDDPHLAAVGFFQSQAHPTEGQVRYTGIPSRWNGAALPITRHAPCLGEHSLPILKEAGVSTADSEALLKSGATIDGEPDAGAAPLHRATLP